jgi:hypothetical protein
MNTNSTRNEWKTSDIRLTVDREGFFDASHKYQGDLLVTCYFPSRTEARRAAVAELMRLKQGGGLCDW